MAGLLPNMSVWGIIEYATFFTVFSVMFTIMNGILVPFGNDIESRWGRQS